MLVRVSKTLIFDFHQSCEDKTNWQRLYHIISLRYGIIVLGRGVSNKMSFQIVTLFDFHKVRD